MGFFDEISKIFGGGDRQNPADVANSRLSGIPSAVNPYYQPYIDRGRAADTTTMGQYDRLISNPGSLYSDLGAGYKESPGYKFKLNQALQAGTNAAAAGGMAGSPMHEQQNMQLANDIASQDFQDYIQQILKLYGIGLEGESNIGERGFKASTGYGDILGSNIGAQAQYDYAGTAGENANRANSMANLFKGAGMLGLGALNYFNPVLGGAATSAIGAFGGGR